jgi:hypothetical protein
MPDDFQATWPSLVADKRRALAEISEAALAVDNESKFRAAFEEICDNHFQTRTQQYLGNFRNQFKPIKAFTGGIDGAGRLTAPENLTSLFWAFAYVATAVSFFSPPPPPSSISLLTRNRRRLITISNLKTSLPH